MEEMADCHLQGPYLELGQMWCQNPEGWWLELAQAQIAENCHLSWECRVWGQPLVCQ